METNLPEEVRELFKKFKEKNYQLFLVGGVVRDLLLKKEIKDWDFTTDATPEQILDVIPDGFYNNKFGTVGLNTEGLGVFEITTMRKEGEYKDSRHPEQVSWTNKVEEDLARRDFTINAIAMGLNSSSSPQGRTINYSSTDPAKPENGEVPSFPCIGLLVSGGHTDLVLFTDHHKYKYLGGTRDDAAGECFDKCARLLGLPYPGGPEISRLSKGANPAAFNLPRPMLGSKDFDFSFSGLKTAVNNLVHSSEFVVSSKKSSTNNQLTTNNLCASIEAAIIDCLVEKTVRAVQEYKVEQIIVAGGVAANQNLVERLKSEIRNFKLEIKLAVPPPYLCTDNGAMVAAAAFFLKPITNPTKLQADPNLSLS